MRAAAAIVLLVDDRDDAARCLRALRGTLPAGVAILAGGTERGRRALEELAGDGEVAWLGAEGVEAWNAAHERAPGADLVLLDGATEVGAGWLDGLRAVADAVPDAATVTALGTAAGYLSAPRRNLAWPLPPRGLTADAAAARVQAGALGLHPRVPTALPHCALVAAAGRQLVGPFDAGLAPREALADFCARATAAGLAHAVADEVLVAHRGAVEEGSPGAWPGEAGRRHPTLTAAVADAATDRHSALARALLSVAVTLEPLVATIDARSLGPGVSGTTVHVVELLGALAARDDVRVRALLPDRVGDEAGGALDALGGRVERVTLDAALGAARTHVAHRPWQIESAQEMAVLDALGERTVLTNQDLIGYRTPGAFASTAAWRDYRAATRDALGLAALVLFFSDAAARDALAEDLVAPERARVVRLGAQARHLVTPAAAQAPAALAGHDRPFLLVLGNRFRHKNVRFALDLLAALRDEQGWDGDLVIAGAEVLHGSGSGDDAAWLLARPQHAAHVVDLGAVGQAEKAWLLETAAAVVYPSTYEGFGLIPFEAAAAGTPCLVAPVSALRETVPDALARLVPWDASASARDAVAVLSDGPERDALVAGLRDAGAGLTWEATAEGLVGAYQDAVRLPAPVAARLTEDVARAERDYWSVRDGIPDPLWTLVRPDAPQLDEPLAAELGELLQAADGRRRLLRGLWLGRKLPGRR